MLIMRTMVALIFGLWTHLVHSPYMGRSISTLSLQKVLNMTAFVAVDLLFILLERWQISWINDEISALIAEATNSGETSAKDDVLDKIRMFGS